MSWNRTRRRHQLVHAVLADIEASGDLVVPARWQDDVDVEFGGFGPFLREVQARWYRAFEARLDALLEVRPADMRAALDRLRRDLAAVMPAARLLLDAHNAHPALTPLHDRHRRMLHNATGVDIREPAGDPRAKAILCMKIVEGET